MPIINPAAKAAQAQATAAPADPAPTAAASQVTSESSAAQETTPSAANVSTTEAPAADTPASESTIDKPSDKPKRKGAKKTQAAPKAVILHNGVGSWQRGDEVGLYEFASEAAYNRLVALGAVCPKGDEPTEDDSE